MARAVASTSIADASSYRKITFEEFLAWDGENRHVEWVDGNVVEMSPVSNQHQEIAGFLIAIFRLYRGLQGGGRVLYEPFLMRMAPSLPARAPDVIYIKEESLHRIHTNYLDGPADLVVEIVSPGSKIIDTLSKRDEYERGGVGEYWLIDPLQQIARFYELQPDAHFQVGETTVDGWYDSKILPGLRVNVSWFWESEMPSELDVMKEWGLV